jgi:YesN/AraC family two-component response regulator
MLRVWPLLVARLSILDIKMPDMNGRVLGEKLHAMFPAMAMLYISGYVEDEALQRGIATGTIQFLSKPVAPETLLAKIEKMLQSVTHPSR